jgi:DNA-binding FadR family transcriptional regulator
MERGMVLRDEAGADNGPRVLPMSGPPVPHRKAAELIAEELRELIVCGGKAGDYLLAERLLVERFDVSRPTLREALRVLESEGLVEIRRGVRGGAVVREPAIEDLARHFGVFLQLRDVTYEDTFIVRTIVEPAAARLSAERIGAGASADRLEEALAAEAEAIAAGDDAAFLSDALVHFHDAVLEACGSTTLLALGKLLETVWASHTHHSMAAITGRKARLEAAGKSHDAHRALAAAILAGDADRAGHLMGAHLHALRSGTGRPRTDQPINMFRPGTAGSIIQLP